MASFAATCIFCEDIREERSGQDSIVGTLPDNLNIEGPPPPNSTASAHIPKIGIYLRANFRIDDEPPKQILARVENNAGTVIARNGWAGDLITKAFENAKSNRMPYAGFILKLVMSPVTIIMPGGKLTAILEVDGQDYVAGALNIILPSASEQPASQSPTAS